MREERKIAGAASFCSKIQLREASRVLLIINFKQLKKKNRT